MDYSHDIESARKAMEARYKDIVAKKSYNLEQWRNFFNAIYSYNNQQGAVGDWQSEFQGCGVVDIRVPGNSLQERWPHYFGVPKMDAPEEVWRKYGSGSQEFDSEFAELRTIYGKVKAHADEVNKRTLEIATTGGYNV